VIVQHVFKNIVRYLITKIYLLKVKCHWSSAMSTYTAYSIQSLHVT